MKDYFNDDTIAAVSTPTGKSGIGIVRLSGRDALAIAEKIFISAKKMPLSSIPTHTLQYGWVVDEKNTKKTFASAHAVDEVLLSVMRAPKTYTREDIVEINCHSGIVVLRKILELVLCAGARLAEPGEYTKRAYLNGRIDLAQAEAVLDVINSKTNNALEVALTQLKGALSQKVKSLRFALIDIMTQLEAMIDFPDQDIEIQSMSQVLLCINSLEKEVNELLDSADKGAMLREGISCAICGRANVGKSSLLNRLLKRDRAIVTPIAGTTRDVLEETLDLFGIPLRLIDTAGIGRGENIAEKEAIKRSKQSIKEASVVLFMIDASEPLRHEDRNIAKSISKKLAFVVMNKKDLPAKVAEADVEKLLPRKKHLHISALRGTGLGQLEKELAKSIWQGKTGDQEQVLVSNIRHIQAFRLAKKFLHNSSKALKSGQSPEIVALELKGAQEALGEIVGEISSDEILGRIFSQFCIGK